MILGENTLQEARTLAPDSTASVVSRLSTTTFRAADLQYECPLRSTTPVFPALRRNRILATDPEEDVCPGPMNESNSCGNCGLMV